MSWFERFREIPSQIETERLRGRQAAKDAERKHRKQENLRHKLRPQIKEVCNALARTTKGKFKTDFDAHYVEVESGSSGRIPGSNDYFWILWGGEWSDSGHFGHVQIYSNGGGVSIEGRGSRGLSGRAIKSNFYIDSENFTKKILAAKLEEICVDIFRRRGFSV